MIHENVIGSYRDSRGYKQELISGCVSQDYLGSIYGAINGIAEVFWKQNKIGKYVNADEGWNDIEGLRESFIQFADEESKGSIKRVKGK